MTIEFGLACEYFRERKKRGKASRKDLQQQQNAGSSGSGIPQSPGACSSEGPSPTQEQFASFDGPKNEQRSFPEIRPPSTRRHTRTMSMSGNIGGEVRMANVSQQLMPGNGEMMSDMSVAGPLVQQPQQPQQQQQGIPPIPENAATSLHVSRGPMGESPTPMSLHGFGLVQDYSRPGLHVMGPMSGTPAMQQAPPIQHVQSAIPSQGVYNAYEGPYSLMSPHDIHPPPTQFPFGRQNDSPLPNFMTGSPVAGSPGWLSLPSPSANALYQPPVMLHPPPNMIRFPVLQCLAPHIQSILPMSLACDLLELYFTSSSFAIMHPLSPYLLGYVFRKRSFLHPTHPRACSPALLCSILWVGAQTSEAPFLNSPPSARGRICQKLLELTVGLLRPLIHGPTSSDTSPNYGMNTVVNGVALGGLGVAMSPGEQTPSSDPGCSGALDDVATYFHLATVISASEYKAASLRWWNAAWSLARELKLGRELPPNPSRTSNRDHNREEPDAHGEADLDVQDHHHHQSNNDPPGFIAEETREERRRIWWLLYTVDRHLALCYNRPLFLLDIECDSLLQPINDNIWQAGDAFTVDSSFAQNPDHPSYRRRGPTFECTGHSIFGYFLPLMTILGEIVDLNHAKNHPRFGVGFRGSADWDDHAADITQQLEAYGRSLEDFEAKYAAGLHTEQQQQQPTSQPGDSIPEASAEQPNPFSTPSATVGTPSARSVASTSTRMTEALIQTKIVVAYGTHVMHVLHILLTGKWDPIALLDDNDLWISSQSFISATGHAVNAAEAISDILEYDPDLSFMPFFFGIYLLQGSFLLLLIADKLQGEASASVVKACETIVRAHEACVVTLNTEYQVRTSLLPFPLTLSPVLCLLDLPC